MNSKKPFSKGDWTVIPNAIFSHLEFLDCDDTIDGICHSTKTLQECIDLCKNDKTGICHSGYFIKTQNGDTFCAPLRENKENTNLYYRLRDKDHYPILNTMSTFVFSNNDYPSDLVNSLFYMDRFTIQTIKNKVYIGIDENSSNLELTNSSPVHFQFLQKEIKQASIENYIHVRNGGDIVLNIPSTTFVLNNSLDEKGNINFRMGVSLSNTNETIFQLYGLNKEKNEILNYSDTFYLMFQEQLIVFDSENGILKLINSNIENALKNKENVLFTLEPKITVYYCDNSSCNSVSLDQTTRVGNNATYKGNPVFRSSKCWNLCKSSSKSSSKLLFLTIVFLILFLVLIMKK